MTRYLGLDFETSGLDSKRHAPVSLGLAVFESGEVIDRSEWLIGPPTDKKGSISREYDVAALQMSRYTWPRIQKAPTPAQICSELAAFVKAHDGTYLPVVAFNAPFDLGFYSELLYLSGGWNQIERRFEGFPPPLVGGWYCARLLASRTISCERFNLDTVAAHFGLSRTSETHGAVEDAVLAGQIWWRLQALRHGTEEVAA